MAKISRGKGEFRKFERGKGRKNNEGRREDLQIIIAEMIIFLCTFHEAGH